MKNITIIMGSVFPVPATKGGAVENLIENIAKAHEQEQKINLNVICAYDKDALLKSKKFYEKTNFTFIKINRIFKFLDKIIAFIAINILNKKNAMAYSYILQRLYYYKKISILLHKRDYGTLVLENSTGLYLSLKWKKNYLKYKDRYYYHCHNKVNMDFRCKEIIDNTKAFISVSDYMSNDLRKFINLNKDNFVTLKNMIDKSKFDIEVADEEIVELKLKYDINPEDKIILFVGRLTEEKGIKELLLAISDIKNKNFKLLIVGSYFFNTNVKNKFLIELDNLINKNKEKIIFTGFIPYDEIHKYYKLADFAVLPSMWEEPAGLTIEEAEVCGLPIITTNSGGIPEYVTKKNAIIVKRNNDVVKNLKKNIEQLMQDEIKITNMKKESLAIAKDINIVNYYNDFIKLI